MLARKITNLDVTRKDCSDRYELVNNNWSLETFPIVADLPRPVIPLHKCAPEQYRHEQCWGWTIKLSTLSSSLSSSFRPSRGRKISIKCYLTPIATVSLQVLDGVIKCSNLMHILEAPRTAQVTAAYAPGSSHFLRLDILDSDPSQKEDPDHSHESSEYDAGPVLRAHSPKT